MTQANNVAIESSQINSSGVLQPAGGGTGVTTSTGSGNTVLSTSPTLVTPVLGTPSSGTLTSCTGLPISTGVSGLGTGVATALGTAVGSAGAPVVNGGVLGTPSSGTLTNCTFPTLNQNTTGTAANITGSTNTTITSLANLVTVGTITTGTWSGSFGAVSGANLTTLNGSNISSGTVAAARLGSGTPSSSNYLRGDGTWSTVAATPGGSTTQVQYNSAGAFAGSSNFTFDGTNVSFNSGFGSAGVAYACRAWATFNGIGSTTIKASGNVSSITYNSTGRYTFNFSNAMPDGNYAVVGMTTGLSTGDTKSQVAIVGTTAGGATTKTTTQCQIGTGDSGNGTPLDKAEIDVIFVR